MINVNLTDEKVTGLSSTCAFKGIRSCFKCEDNKKMNKEKAKECNIIIDLTPYVKIRESGNIKEIYLNIDSQYQIQFIGNLEKSIKENIMKINSELNLEANKVLFNLTNLFEGVFLITDLFSEEETLQILEEMNKQAWVDSQSGRKKQDYGPKINYKKRKVKNLKEDVCFPSYLDQTISPKLKSVNCPIVSLTDFTIAEMGNLLYSPTNGSSIDPHIDDYWIWGRIVGVNLKSDCCMTFSKEVEIDTNDLDNKIRVLYEINVPIKKNDVYIMSGSSRYIWKHGIKRESIPSERIVVTLREFEYTFKENNSIGL